MLTSAHFQQLCQHVSKQRTLFIHVHPLGISQHDHSYALAPESQMDTQHPNGYPKGFGITRGARSFQSDAPLKGRAVLAVVSGAPAIVGAAK